MQKDITSFVGLDVHKDSIAIRGRAGRGARHRILWAAWHRSGTALSKALVAAWVEPRSCRLFTRLVLAGYTLARELRSPRVCLREVVAPGEDRAPGPGGPDQDRSARRACLLARTAAPRGSWSMS